MISRKTYFNDKRLDYMLRMFDGAPGGFIDNGNLFSEPIEDWAEAVSFLTKEGYLEELRYGRKITYKGKLLIDQGGFVGKHRSEAVAYLATVVAAVASVIAAVASVLALLM